MITTILFGILLIPISIISALLQGISNTVLTSTINIIPNQIFTSITTLISYLGYFNGIFPIDTFMVCLGILITFYIFWYTYKIALWIWAFIPWIGTKNEFKKTDNDMVWQSRLDKDQLNRWRSYVKKRGGNT